MPQRRRPGVRQRNEGKSAAAKLSPQKLKQRLVSGNKVASLLSSNCLSSRLSISLLPCTNPTADFSQHLA